MAESVLLSTSWELTATYFRGSNPIDAIWATQDLEVLNACAMPIGYSIGDHRSFIVDFSTCSLVGKIPNHSNSPRFGDSIQKFLIVLRPTKPT